MTAGNRITNSLPCPEPALRASMVPLCISTSRLTSVSPMPRPAGNCSGDRCTWVKISKTRGNMSAGMPIPVSFTEITTSPFWRSTDSAIRPPRSVYLEELLSRFETTCASRVRSPSR